MNLWEFACDREPSSDVSGRKLTVEADTEKLSEVVDFVMAYLEENDASMKANMQVELALEEAYVNIAHYAYGENKGSADVYVGPIPTDELPKGLDEDIAKALKTVSMDESIQKDGMVCIALKDSGQPYDPLLKENPDITLSAEDRQIGGLGIFLIRKYMDDVKYVYVNGSNLLVMYKNIA